MKYIDEYRDKALAEKIAREIDRSSTGPLSFMEVCGGHTMAVRKFGIPSLLPDRIRLLSGPGCPVCVSSNRFIDRSVALSRRDDVIITSFGDLIRVPGSSSSLEKEKAKGADIRVVYSVLDALRVAKDNPLKRIVFLGIGFETTAPTSAAAIRKAFEQKMNNFFLLSAHKIMPPAMEALADEGVKLNGYIAPGHVSTITGTGIYKNIPEKYGLGCVISGFEPVDLLQSIYMLVKQCEENNPKVEIQYKRAVKEDGNRKALQLLQEVFVLADDWWRGLGVLKNSGLQLRETYEQFNAFTMIDVDVEETKEPKGCICGEILKGLKNPKDCKLFSAVCNPSLPVGACMVSNEGACNAWYRYNR
ncbi:MAG: hydrogenase formation protein HypD [Bacteroidales bacterium]|nr:MAG: hydrogenase formation protein HypD [Bacteroidales bacterium]